MVGLSPEKSPRSGTPAKAAEIHSGERHRLRSAKLVIQFLRKGLRVGADFHRKIERHHLPDLQVERLNGLHESSTIDRQLVRARLDRDASELLQMAAVEGGLHNNSPSNSAREKVMMGDVRGDASLLVGSGRRRRQERGKENAST